MGEIDERFVENILAISVRSGLREGLNVSILGEQFEHMDAESYEVFLNVVTKKIVERIIKEVISQ